MNKHIAAKVYPVQDAHDAKGCLVARRYASVALDDLRDTTRCGSLPAMTLSACPNQRLRR